MSEFSRDKFQHMKKDIVTQSTTRKMKVKGIRLYNKIFYPRVVQQVQT